MAHLVTDEQLASEFRLFGHEVSDGELHKRKFDVTVLMLFV